MDDTLSGRVQFGKFEFDLSTGELCSIEGPGGGRRALLREQAFQVLRMLGQRTDTMSKRLGPLPRYWCNGDRGRQMVRSCITFSGGRVDQSVAVEVLELPHCILQIGKESAHGEHLGASYAKPTPAVPFLLSSFPLPHAHSPLFHQATCASRTFSDVRAKRSLSSG
jgi:hypothetical protein